MLERSGESAAVDESCGRRRSRSRPTNRPPSTRAWPRGSPRGILWSSSAGPLSLPRRSITLVTATRSPIIVRPIAFTFCRPRRPALPGSSLPFLLTSLFSAILHCMVVMKPKEFYSFLPIAIAILLTSHITVAQDHWPPSYQPQPEQPPPPPEPQNPYAFPDVSGSKDNSSQQALGNTDQKPENSDTSASTGGPVGPSAPADQSGSSEAPTAVSGEPAEISPLKQKVLLFNQVQIAQQRLNNPRLNNPLNHPLKAVRHRERV
uniref:Uncharacterized protein n=1 Tax=Plectus sambesii TaxID=2011161 RepID=A0A914WEQ4_9BILA